VTCCNIPHVFIPDFYVCDKFLHVYIRFVLFYVGMRCVLMGVHVSVVCVSCSCRYFVY